jgi:hypothetical protein
MIPTRRASILRVRLQATHRRAILETLTKRPDKRILCQEHDVLAIPEDIPALGIEAGDEGIVRKLDFQNNVVTAFVMITYSTGQLRGWVLMELRPDIKVSSYTVN